MLHDEMKRLNSSKSSTHAMCIVNDLKLFSAITKTGGSSSDELPLANGRTNITIEIVNLNSNNPPQI